jgi:hypothetical protein
MELAEDLLVRLFLFQPLANNANRQVIQGYPLRNAIYLVRTISRNFEKLGRLWWPKDTFWKKTLNGLFNGQLKFGMPLHPNWQALKRRKILISKDSTNSI